MAMKIRTRPTNAGAVAQWAIVDINDDHAGTLQFLRLVEDPFVQVEVNVDPTGEDWKPAPTIEHLRTALAAKAASVQGNFNVAPSGVVQVPQDVADGIRQLTEVMLDAMAAGKIAVPTLEQIQRDMDRFKELPVRFGVSAEALAEGLLSDDDDELDVAGTGKLPAVDPTLERDQPDTTAPESAGAEGTEEGQTQTLEGAQNAASSQGQPDAGGLADNETASADTSKPSRAKTRAKAEDKA